MAELTELGQILHEEHFRILVLICGLQNRITGKAAERPLNLHDDDDRNLLEELATSLNQVIEHNVFEEKVLFPMLSKRGVAELTSLLTQEHDNIGPMVNRVRGLAAEILRCGPSIERQVEFQAAASDLVHEMQAHLQTEELAIVQRLREFMDAETDHRLALVVAEDRIHQAESKSASVESATRQAGARRPSPVSMAARNAARRRSTATQSRPGGY